MKKKLLLLILPLILVQQHLLHAQQITDSLFKVLSKEKEDTAKVNTLNALAYEFKNNDPDTAVYFANEALSLSTKLEYQLGIADAYLCIGTAINNLGEYEDALKNLNDAIKLYELLLVGGNARDRNRIMKQEARVYNNMGNIYCNQGKYPEALKNHAASLKIKEETGDKQGVAISYHNIGNVYNLNGSNPEALKNYLAALKIFEETGNKNGIASSLGNIGTVYYNQDNYPEALKNQLAALKIRDEMGDDRGIADSYNNIGNIYYQQNNYPEALKNYFASLEIRKEIKDDQGIALNYNNIANIYDAQHNYPEALKNQLAALKIQEEIEDKKGAGGSYHNIGGIYYAQGNFEEAFKNFLTALKIFEEIGDKNGVAASYNSIGSFYTQQKTFDKAEDYLNKGLILAQEIGSLDDIKSSYNGLVALDSTQGHFREAFEHHKLYIAYRDSLYNEENTKKIVQTQMQYDFDKQQDSTKAEQDKKDIVTQAEIKKQKLIRNSISGGLAVVAVFAIVFFIQRKRISKARKRSDELLLNILPSETAEELKATGSAVAKDFDQVTVMFTDFKDFTQASEKMTAHELVNEINRYFSQFDHIISKHNIEKIKTIGDSYMCAGGLPVPNQSHATDVVHAALEIQQFMKQQQDSSQSFEIRIGIHTGPVVAGIVGIKKFAYDIWGDAVNTASRMESSGEAGKVNISGATYQIVKDEFTCTYRGKITAKHKGEIDMYFVEARRAT